MAPSTSNLPVERRQHSHIKGPDMDDLKERLSRIEVQNTGQLVEQRVLNNSFETHKVQNERDFEHVDDCIHRSDSESKARDDDIKQALTSLAADTKAALSSIADDVARMRDTDIAELKKFMWKTGGALLILVPLVQHVISRFQ